VLCFARQPIKTKQLARISSSVMLVWFVFLLDRVTACNYTVACCNIIARYTTKLRDKIAGATSVYTRIFPIVEYTAVYVHIVSDKHIKNSERYGSSQSDVQAMKFSPTKPQNTPGMSCIVMFVGLNQYKICFCYCSSSSSSNFL